MARLIFPDNASIDRVQATPAFALLSASGATARVYLDAAGTQLADITNADGSANASATLTLDNVSRLPDFQGPTSGIDKLYVRVDGGAPLEVEAKLGQRFGAQNDAVTAQLAAQDAAFSQKIADFYTAAGATYLQRPERGLTELLAAMAPGKGLVALGDSITRHATQDPPVAGVTVPFLDGAWPQLACAMTGQRLRFLKNAGITGNTTQQMIDRFATDVTPFAPGIVTILAGRNDVQFSGISKAAWLAKIATLVGLVRGIGAVPVLCTLLPAGDSATYAAQIIDWNTALRGYAVANDVFLLDFHQLAVDPATGGYKAAFGSTDGVHPGYSGDVILAKYVVGQIARFLPTATPKVATLLGDSNNLWADALFTAAPAGNGLSTAFGVTGSTPAGASFSQVGDPEVPGRLQRITTVGTSAPTIVQQGFGRGALFSPGDVLEASGVVTVRGTGDASIELWFGGADIPGTLFRAYAGQNVTRARFLYRYKAPSDATQARLSISRQAGTGTFDVGQLSLYNATSGQNV